MRGRATSRSYLPRRELLKAGGALAVFAMIGPLVLATDNDVDLRKVRDKTLKFIESMRVAEGAYGRYRYAAGCHAPTLYSSTYAAMTRHLCGDMASLSATQRAEWVESSATKNGTAAGPNVLLSVKGWCVR